MKADLILKNGKIYTLCHESPWVESIACRKGKIIAIGSTEQLKALSSSKTTEIDLEGHFAMPGYNDAHVDFFRGGRSLRSVDLRFMKSKHELQTAVAKYIATRKQGEWILEGNWNHEIWPDKTRPDKALLDPVSPNNPVFLCRADQHVSVANSVALKLAGITKDTLSPEGGEIEKDPVTGEPNGVLIDTAQEIVNQIIPEPDLALTVEYIKAGMEYAASLGITSIQDNSTAMTLQAYQQLLENNELTVRVNIWRPVAIISAFKSIGLLEHFGNDMIRCGVMKIFADGSMGAGSAFMFDSYTDNEKSCGLSIYPQEKLTQMITEVDASGLQCAVHAIGDRANHMVLNAYESAIINNPMRDRRHRVEHAQIIKPVDLDRFARLGLVASVQPAQYLDDIDWAENRIGKERLKDLFLWKSFLNRGVKVVFGTDWPVAAFDPMVTLYAATTRKTEDGRLKSYWNEDEKLNLAEAIECYTLNGAYAEFMESQKGSLEVDKCADIIVLSDNPFEMEPEKLMDTKVDKTIFNGNLIYERAGA